ncbi:molybdenum cofactor biosynthesis protein MoaE [Persicobacter diffluens]|uniref:Molybdopterin synthase catalytic subunit n=1 Tax=Persicobacter diffluens TaxID=981 RepID=A0AAN4W2C4_9BACT|nr:molybdopterin synthase catalytic subunit [Persicobacter diffluens]
MNQIDIKIKEHLDVQACIDFVQHPQSGANNLFVGKVRDHANGQKVVRLDFEAYEPMAVKEMEIIALRALEIYDVHRIAIHHTVGEKQIGEMAVIIAVGSAHRKAGFEACEFAIDELKKTVPIWKKEHLENGTVWVSAHP